MMSEDFRVLIVDDDFHVAKLHAAYVDSVAGFLALPPAGSASLALQSIHSLRPDLVLLDVYLPDASGLDLLHQLDVDTMILSAASDAASLRTAFRRGALGYLLKPFTAESLSQQLRSYARYRRILAQPGSLDQDTVERAKRALIPGDVSPSAKPRSATEAAVLESLVPGEQYSAAEVAGRVGVSRATAQRYLSSLADDGAVEIQLRYGTTGRPEHRYGLPASYQSANGHLMPLNRDWKGHQPPVSRGSGAGVLAGALLGDEFDLHEHLRVEERQHVHQGQRGADLAEDLAVGAAGVFPLADVRQVQLGLHDVGEAEAGVGQDRLQLLEDVPGLLVEVAADDAVLTAGGGGGDVQRVVHLDCAGIAEGLFPDGAGAECLAHGAPFTGAACRPARFGTVGMGPGE